MFCARCKTENSASARYCDGCGSPLTASAEKEFEKPVLVAKPLQPTVAAAAEPWRWGIAIVGGALLLYHLNFVVTACLLRLGNSSLPGAVVSRLGIYAALAGAGCCGLALALPDAKTSLTAILGSVVMRSVLALLLGSSRGLGVIPIGWLVLCGVSLLVLWELWLDRPRERGDAARMSMALTVLVSAEALSAAYSYGTHPALIQVRPLAMLAIVMGALLCLRVWIPSAIANGERRI
jgi:hypothetical protein